MEKNIVGINYTQFLEELEKKVVASRYKAALSVNRELILLYHQIRSEIIKSQKTWMWS